MKCESCKGTGKSSKPGQKCFFCNGSGQMCDACGEALKPDDIDLGTGCCQKCEDERNAEDQDA